ncbi:MAG TPA: hypothetical protein VEJ63_22765 [Planctomycetota bacterium]|nr:hypothetical protein [Planctomycetota bacterium]
MAVPFRTLCLVIVAASALHWNAVRSAEESKPPTKAAEKVAPRTLEEQIVALENALAEGIVQRDWKMLELAASGLKAAGLTGKDLEISILRSERGASWSSSAYMQQARLECWGLIARVLAGDTGARKLLDGYADANPEPVRVPAAPAGFQKSGDDQKAYQRAMADYQKYTLRLQQRDEALLVLALMKASGVSERIKLALGRPRLQSAYYTYSNPLVSACLIADKDKGLQTLLEYAADEEGSIGEQLGVLSALQTLLVLRGQETAFSVDHDAAAVLPENTAAQLGKPASALIARYAKIEHKETDGTLNALINFAHRLPPNALTKDAAQDLSDLRFKLSPHMQQWMKPQIDEILKKNGVDPNTAAKPPAPPGDF